MSLKRTPLFEIHRQSGGRMVPFAGWEMPVQYTSIIEEHNSVRNSAGLFDVSHMGELIVSGADATEFLDRMCCNRIQDIKTGKVQYNAVMNDQGGIVDDITIYKISDTEYFVVSNASNYEAVFAHFSRYRTGAVECVNESDRWHQIAIQGPEAESILQSATGLDTSDIAYYAFDDRSINGKNYRISRTGYTGEDGFEIYTDVPTGLQLWQDLLHTGESRLLPAGLGARDSLRLEAGYPLYGHELNAQWTPVQSGIGWIAKEKERPYLGYEQVMDHKQNGAPGRVVGFKQQPGGLPRDEYPVLNTAGENIARVLSGGHSPTLKQGIGTVYLPKELTESGTEIRIQIRDRQIPAHVHRGPFVKGSAGKK